MNAAHYTVWLYRFKIVATLDIPMADEIAWLNRVALENLKNYQIWHHRQLLADHYLPKMSENAEEVKKFARSEMQFLGRILEEDTKNYHVWSYRQYLVGKLNLFSLSELLSTQNFIEDDVRNNSAWSHRFFLIFSDPSASTKGSHATELDPKIAAETVDREIAYCKEKIDLAPQNQSPWNYLKAVLIKGGRDFQELKDFALRFVNDLGGEEETVTSTHALEFLATMYEEAKDDETALVCLRRLSDKWDASRAEYWIYREQMLLFREP
jgi:protein farnesyltransferase/geranylgeranyltransferase type-1 subunit alpha